jgi:hypothetical protein
MTTTTALTANDITRASLDERWLGFGYLGERHNRIRLAEQELTGSAADAELLLVAAADQRVVDLANAAGLDYDGLFSWLNSKPGRWFGDVVFGGSGRFDARIDEAVRHHLSPRVIAD